MIRNPSYLGLVDQVTWLIEAEKFLERRVNYLAEIISQGGGGGVPSLTSTQIGYGSGSNLLTGNSAFTYLDDPLNPLIDSFNVGFTASPFAIFTASNANSNNPLVAGGDLSGVLNHTWFQVTDLNSTFIVNGNKSVSGGIVEYSFSWTGGSLVFSGVYTGYSTAIYSITIDGVGTPNTFTWSDGTTTVNNVAITGFAQLLSNGISVTFPSTTGFTLGSSALTDYTSTYGQMLSLDGQNHQYIMGDVNNTGVGMNFSISELFGTSFEAQIYDLAGLYFLVDAFNHQYQLGDINGTNNGTLLTIDDINQFTTLKTNGTLIGKINNFDADVTGQFYLGTLPDIPVITSSLGVYNTIRNSTTGDVALVGSGDLTALGGSTEAAILAHFGGDLSQAYIYTDIISGTPTVTSLAYSDGGDSITVTQNPTTYSVVGGTNGTLFTIDDTNKVVSQTNACAYPTMDTTDGGTDPYTIPSSVRGLYVDPPLVLLNLTIQMPANPVNGQEIEIWFGGTITNGDVVTTLTFTPNTGQTIVGTAAALAVIGAAGNKAYAKYREATSQWYIG